MVARRPGVPSWQVPELALEIGFPSVLRQDRCLPDAPTSSPKVGGGRRSLIQKALAETVSPKPPAFR